MEDRRKPHTDRFGFTGGEKLLLTLAGIGMWTIMLCALALF